MPVTYKTAKLENGLTIAAELNPEAHTASAGFFVKTGARDEEAPQMGVSHFLEHMMFKGTDKRSADDVNREFDDLGADYNAWTSTEITCFYATVLPERFDPAVDLLADIMRPAIRQADFDAEKKVIVEEIAMYEDNPFWAVYEEAMERHFGGTGGGTGDSHGLGFRVLGTRDTVNNLSRDTMQAYFDHRYSADNTTLALAGNIDFHHAIEHANKLVGHWQTTGATRNTNAAQTTPTRFDLNKDTVNRGYLLMLANGPSAQSDDRYAAAMLAQLLGEAGNSKLHWALVETGLAEAAQAAYDGSDHAGLFYVFAMADPDKLAEIEQVVDKEIANVLEGTTDKDLERLRNKAALSATIAGERPAGRMQRLGRLLTTTGDYRSLEKELNNIRSVTLDDIKRVSEQYPFEPRTVGRLLPT